MEIPEVLGTVPGWITAGSTVTAAGIALKAWLARVKLSQENEDGIRDHYAKELAALRGQILLLQQSSDLRAAAADKRYDDAIKAADLRHNQCQEEVERQRHKLTDMQEEIDALHRRISAQGHGVVALFEPAHDIPQDMQDHIRSLRQDEAPDDR